MSLYAICDSTPPSQNRIPAVCYNPRVILTPQIHRMQYQGDTIETQAQTGEALADLKTRLDRSKRPGYGA